MLNSRENIPGGKYVSVLLCDNVVPAPEELKG